MPNATDPCCPRTGNECPNGVARELVVEEKNLANREGMCGEVTAGVKWSGQVMGLREWVLGVFVPPILEKYC